MSEIYVSIANINVHTTNCRRSWQIKICVIREDIGVERYVIRPFFHSV